MRRALRRWIGSKRSVPLGALHICRACRSDFVNPTYWESEAAEVWRVGLRCGACGFERETVIGPTLAEMFDKALDTRYDRLAETAQRLEAASMAEWVESFTAALEHDLIEAEDFAGSS
jgi:hypothetical protein